MTTRPTVTEITRCRICGNSVLEEILDLGEQYLTGIFPRTRTQRMRRSPLRLVKCSEDVRDSCGLLQLKHSCTPEEMYGSEYGYRSGLNDQMVQHLQRKVDDLLRLTKVDYGDLVIDIGSSDSTLLRAYPKNKNLRLIGIDPSGPNFKDFYPENIELIPAFFSADVVKQYAGQKRAKIVTAVAMFYDIESPMNFMREVYDILAEDGVWHFEQSYMPTMLDNTSFDTICQEHLEYYRLKQIKWVTDRVGFKIIDLGFNDANGGSFFVTVARNDSRYSECTAKINTTLEKEEESGLGTLKPYLWFRENVFLQKRKLIELVRGANVSGKKVLGLGASTKGNVILQLCGFSEDDIPCIGDVNPNKFGCYTPGTLIPIVPESRAIEMRPDYFLVFPWHFREFFIKNKSRYGSSSLIFPLPQISIV